MTTSGLSSILLSVAFTCGSLSLSLDTLAADASDPGLGTGQAQQSLDLTKKHGPAKGKGQGPGTGPGTGHGTGGRVFEMFRSIDTNGDGLISADEAAARREKVFQSLVGKDGDSLTADKFLLPANQASAKKVSKTSKKDGHKDFQELSYAGMQARKKQVFKSMDENNDGKVTKDEFMAAGKKRFEESDTDKDGYLTAWEFSQKHHRF